jgi:hypothetical protein
LTEFQLQEKRDEEAEAAWRGTAMAEGRSLETEGTGKGVSKNIERFVPYVAKRKNLDDW